MLHFISFLCSLCNSREEMANYAAVLSLIHTLNNINNHPKPPISLHQSHLDSLTQNLTFFQHFLETYPTQEDHDLEGRIAAAAYAAEDVIETHIVHQIHQARCTSGHARNISSVDLYGDLERVIQDMDLIKIMTPHLSSGAPASSTWQSTTMPVLDDTFIYDVLDKLTWYPLGLQIIPIVGMGKTTFASAIYSHPLIVQHFDIMAWVTISQEYSRANVLKLLCQQIKGSVDDMSSEDEMGLILFEHLWDRRYLIVMDDMWSVEALDEVESFFPDNKVGSRIMITTTLSNLNFMLSGFPDIHIKIHPGPPIFQNISSVDLYGDLERVIQEMDLIKTEVMEIIQHKKILTLTPHLSSGAPASTWQSSTKPVFDDAIINQVLDKLTGHQSGLQTIPIVGMGGIGKTTFASAIYSHPLIVQHFDIMAWVTISQEYSRANVLKLLCQQIKGGVNDLSEKSEDEMGLFLYQHLCGRRYLIVMDDVWSAEALDEVKSFFPDNNGERSRIMITTRLSNLNFILSGFPDIHMQVLDEDKSWNLLCKIVFGELDCPIELKDIGKEIAKNCRGLPLSIAVIGGLLIKSAKTRAHWESILQNLSSLINLEADEYCQQLLLRSYKELPIHLKPCFLYMGVFPEDFEINVSHVIKLWISEGILKPNDGKSLEEVAAEYLKELIDRNLILVHELRWNGEAKECKIHDLLRDVCVREAEKQKFLRVLRQQKNQSPQDTHVECRICVFNDDRMEKYSPEFLHAVSSASLARSFLYCVHNYWHPISRVPFLDYYSPSPRFPLLRVHSSVTKRSEVVTASNNAVFEQANLRYVYLNFRPWDAEVRLSSLCSLLWNVQTLEVDGIYYLHLFKIWGMPLLRHFMLNTCVLPDPLDGEDKFVLGNLQTLSCIHNFIFSEEVVKRIPNVEKLKVEYKRTRDNEDEGLPNLCLNNLGRLQKLESFSLEADFPDSRVKEYIPKNLVCFPHSLKKLSLIGTGLNWEDLNIRVGTLPLLQVLKLSWDACVGPTWETVEGKFCSLRVLIISNCRDLKYWNTDNTHFPCLEHLSLQCLYQLEEIPLSIGDIPPLKVIELRFCSKSALHSAERIKEKQLEYGNEDLQFEIVED